MDVFRVEAVDGMYTRTLYVYVLAYTAYSIEKHAGSCLVNTSSDAYEQSGNTIVRSKPQQVIKYYKY